MQNSSRRIRCSVTEAFRASRPASSALSFAVALSPGLLETRNRDLAYGASTVFIPASGPVGINNKAIAAPFVFFMRSATEHSEQRTPPLIPLRRFFPKPGKAGFYNPSTRRSHPFLRPDQNRLNVWVQ